MNSSSPALGAAQPTSAASDSAAGVAPPVGDARLRQGEAAFDLPDVVSGANPLLTAANRLLNLIPQLRSLPHHPNPAALQSFLADQVREFEQRSREAGIRPETIIGARYCLCTALDETAAQTPWGGSGVWGKHSLLVTFHNETWGGEKFFQVLAKLAENPQQHIDLLELMNVCLALGFEGRYRVIDNGRTQLETLRQRLADIIRTARGEIEPPLSPHWRGESDEGHRRAGWLPVWVLGAVAVLVAVGLYVLLARWLGEQSDPLTTAIHSLRLPPMAAPVVRPGPPRLAKFLEPEIREGLLTVSDEADRSIIVLRGDGMFDVGQTTVKDRYVPVLHRIAAALDTVTGNVQVDGHTDSTPIRTVRFPSNWHLSRERAEVVKSILDARMATRGRVRSEGRADGDPVAPNDTAENRARNRRVVVTLLLPPAERDRQINDPTRPTSPPSGSPAPVDRPAASAPDRGGDTSPPAGPAGSTGDRAGRTGSAPGSPGADPSRGRR